MNMVFQRSEEGFEPLEAFSGFLAKFLVVGDGTVDFDDPGKVLSFGGPGFDDVWGGGIGRSSCLARWRSAVFQ